MDHRGWQTWLAITMFVLIITPALQQGSIPDHLLSCYRYPPKLLPRTMDTLIEIIRKIELTPNFNMDMKMLATALLHRFRLDGIERDPNVMATPSVIPYRVSGFQTYRQQLLYQYLIPSNGMLFPNETLTETEKCTLHWMLSSTVNPWERGDESQTCQQSVGLINSWPQPTGAKMSSCPEEWGVVYNHEGTVSPGTVIAAIAAALSPLSVNQTQILSSIRMDPKYGWSITPNTPSVNNTWAATLAGDLAEVIEFQAVGVSSIYIGPGGTWNDTYIPTAHYFQLLDRDRIEKKTWQMTDAEILGGVDGLILSTQTEKLTNQMSRPRLSQVLEMYYSDRGLYFDNNKKACNREMNIENIMRTERQELLSQVISFTGLLNSMGKVQTYFNNTFITPAGRQTIDIFLNYLSGLMVRTRCITQPMESKKLNLSVVIDQTWPSFVTLQIMMFMSKAIDVSYYGSTMSVINGQLGNSIVTATKNTTNVYLSWQTPFTEPYELNLPKALIAVKRNVESKIENDKRNDVYNSQGHVTLIMGYSTAITDRDQDKAKSLISGIKSVNPDMKFIYVTSRRTTQQFVRLTGLAGSQNDKIVVIDNVISLPSFLTKLTEPLLSVPRSLQGPFCQGMKGLEEAFYEEYITPGQPIKYRIHPDYLCGSKELNIQVKNTDYGTIQVCKSRTEEAKGDYQCHSLLPNEDFTFKIIQPCEKRKSDNVLQWSDRCLPIYIDVTVQSTLNKCSENGCRYPDQVKYSITLRGLRCVEPFKTICSSAGIIIPEYALFYYTILFLLYTFT